MKQTFTVLFYLKKSKINSKDKAPIYVRVTVNGKRSEMSIKQFVEPSKWNPIKQRLNGSNYHLKTINKSIELVVNKINEIHNSLIQNNKFVSGRLFLFVQSQKGFSFLPFSERSRNSQKYLVLFLDATINR